MLKTEKKTKVFSNVTKRRIESKNKVLVQAYLGVASAILPSQRLSTPFLILMISLSWPCQAASIILREVFLL